MRNSNLAYQLPKREEEVRQQPRIVRVPKAKPAAKPASPFKVLLFLTVILGMTSAVMFSRAQVTEINDQINAANKQLETLKSENVRLSTELEGRISLKNVAEYATTELGLEKLDPSQIEYIALTENKPVEVKAEESGSIWQKIKNFFVDMMEYIGL